MAALLAAGEVGHTPLGLCWGWAPGAFWVRWATETGPAAASGAAGLWLHMTRLVPYKAVHDLTALAASALWSCLQSSVGHPSGRRPVSHAHPTFCDGLQSQIA